MKRRSLVLTYVIIYTVTNIVLPSILKRFWTVGFPFRCFHRVKLNGNDFYNYVFTRLSFPHMQSVNNVPDGCGSIQVEIYFSKKYKPLNNNPNEYVNQAINDLIKCGLLTKNDKILFKEARIIEYANIIFDLDRNEYLKIVQNYLDEIKIKYCGRYGEWGYLWTDESFKSGEKAASKIIKEIKK